MRIIGGALRGLVLADVGAGDPGAHLRPTGDRVREAIFNLLINGGYGDPVTGARVLDLFAGTGALGLEAVSRGAGWVTFVDNGAVAGRILARNVELTRAGGLSAVVKRDALALGVCAGAAHGLVFVDPPYGMGLGERALVAAQAGGWIAPGALVVWEEGGACAPPEGFRMVDRRTYGGTVVTVMRGEG